jgi:glycosyltransferase involved in cell wall biosynthesis
MNGTIAVCQMGARMHYAVPRILHAAGRLERFFTDICAVGLWARLLAAIPDSLRPASVRRLLSRVPRGVPRARTTMFARFGIEYSRRLASARAASEMTAVFLWAGKTFCEHVIRAGLGNARGVYTFNTAGLELLVHARRRGMKTIVEQTIAPREVEARLLAREREAHPDWEPGAFGDEYEPALAAREREEWENADLILCGSEFVRDAIASCSGPAQRCVVVPYGVDSRFSLRTDRTPRCGPLRVLTVGAVGLRKGSPYVLAAAQQLGTPAEFRIVGSTASISNGRLDQLRNHADVRGVVPRAEIFEHYTWADVFLLPSLCEGSATVTYEALAAGLPVIATPNTGSCVCDGVDGFIVPIADAGAIAAKIEMLANDRELLKTMSRNALDRAEELTVEAYGARLLDAVGKLLDE